MDENVASDPQQKEMKHLEDMTGIIGLESTLPWFWSACSERAPGG